MMMIDGAGKGTETLERLYREEHRMALDCRNRASAAADPRERALLLRLADVHATLSRQLEVWSRESLAQQEITRNINDLYR